MVFRKTAQSTFCFPCSGRRGWLLVGDFPGFQGQDEKICLAVGVAIAEDRDAPKQPGAGGRPGAVDGTLAEIRHWAGQVRC